jgi:hypothetical protein
MAIQASILTLPNRDGASSGRAALRPSTQHRPGLVSHHRPISPAFVLSRRRTVCNSAYSRDNISTVVSLLILCFYGGILAIIGRAFFQQSLDPMFGRTQLAPAYGMSNFPPQPQGGYVPPPGPPGGFAPPQGGFAPPAGPPPSGFAPPPGPPPMGAGYGYGAGSSQNPFADQKEIKMGPDTKDDPFADFERIPNAERDIVGTRPAPGGRERFDV